MSPTPEPALTTEPGLAPEPASADDPTLVGDPFLDYRTPRHSGYRHEAFLHRGDDEFLAGGIPFVRSGLDAGEPVLVALWGERLDWFRDALGSDADGSTATLHLVDLAGFDRNPARLLAALQDFLDVGAGLPLRTLGESMRGARTPEEIAEYNLHEALLNTAVDPDLPFWLRCAYDVDLLDASVIEEAAHSHPVLAEAGDWRGSTHYEGLHHVQALFRQPLPEPDVATEVVAFGADDLRTLRGVVGAAAGAVGLTAEREAEVVLAVHEIAVNSVRHGGGSGRLRRWSTPASLVYEIADAGSIDDPLVGRIRPPVDAEGGRGVWIAHQLSDLVQIRSAGDGTTIRITTWR